MLFYEEHDTSCYLSYKETAFLFIQRSMYENKEPDYFTVLKDKLKKDSANIAMESME